MYRCCCWRDNIEPKLQIDAPLSRAPSTMFLCNYKYVSGPICFASHYRYCHHLNYHYCCIQLLVHCCRSTRHCYWPIEIPQSSRQQTFLMSKHHRPAVPKFVAMMCHNMNANCSEILQECNATMVLIMNARNAKMNVLISIFSERIMTSQ